MSLPDDITKKFCIILQEILQEDPEALNQFFKTAIPCKKELANHPTILVREEATENGFEYCFSMLGIINSILNTLDQRRIAALVDENDKVLKFKPYRAE